MPAQTTKTANVFFPDGCLVEVDNGSGYFDLGATNSAVANTLEYTENEVETANAGTTKKQIRQMKISGGFTLINLDPEGVEKMGGGLFERVTVAGGSVNPEDQVLSAPQVLTTYELVLADSDGVEYRPTSTPSITSVTGSTSGVISSADYDVVADTGSSSGYVISFESGAVDGSEDVTIVYPSQTMNGSQILYAGSSTDILTAYSLRFTHTDDNSKIRRLEIFSADTTSGGFQFNFKGANEDGVEEMPLAYMGKIDTSRTNGRQLMAWTVEDGAE